MNAVVWNPVKCSVFVFLMTEDYAISLSLVYSFGDLYSYSPLII
jgi:hypothetical protein